MDKNRFTELKQKEKDGSITPEEKAELLKLSQRKPNRKDRRQGKQHGREGKGFRPGNDFAWWNKLPELLSDAANYKCNYIAGRPIASTDIPYTLPGVACIVLGSVYGNNVSATDAINVWARDLYLKMFQKYRPASGYSASDLGIAILAGLEIVKLVAKYERVYGIINRYSILNVNMPLIEAEALGLNVTTVNYLQAHMSDFRYDLNFLIRKAQRLCIPKDMSAIADAISLFGYEYLDHENARGQIIMFDVRQVGYYDETTLASGGAINFRDLDSTFPMFDFNAGNMCAALDQTLQALIGSDSIQRIYADLVVWFGQEAMLQFLPIPEEYIVIPAYSESILHKMHNMETFEINSMVQVSWADPNLTAADQSVVNNGTFWLYQCDDRIVTKCGLRDNSTGTNTTISVDGGTIVANNGGVILPCTTNAHVIDTYRVDVTPETITEGVLLKNHSRVVYDATGGFVTMLDSCGFYFVRHIVLHTNGGSPDVFTLTTSNTATIAQARAGRVAVLDWAPLSYYSGVAGQTTTPIGIYGDLDSLVPIYGNGLDKILRTVLLSGVHTDVTPRV